MNKLIFLLICSLTLGVKSFSQENVVLNPQDFKHYFDGFNHDDNELYQQYIPNDSAWTFLKSAIPFF
ncbi:MAG: hypothetical protein LBV72_11155 [Tannerella sp.]|jgi:hypothetical protein|nr:hypothetical protein [Tannerella sp.]